MDNRTEVEKWIEFAENDYQAAVLLSKNIKPLLEIVCFHCQQCAEKYLKAFIIKSNSEIKQTHNLEELLKICVKIQNEFDSLIDNCIDLSDYAVETRYPYPFELDINDMNKALKDMESIRNFILSKFTS
ncbi:MAG: HEPN domain-containing protein [Candidatus Delongbacteria bacterium]|nr:HEPN domain-containing protein [Candidatus Delongbacteria bacterium]MCG2759801.1 HEPN domain-containing protein [Candidatus Delongbacteria bacterium]